MSDWGTVADQVVGPTDWGDESVLADLFDDDERPYYALASSDGIKHTTDGRTTRIATKGGHGGYVIATDRRVLVVLGDNPSEPELDLPYEFVTDCTVDSGLLSTSVSLSTE